MFYCLQAKDEDNNDFFIPLDNVNYFAPNYSDKKIYVYVKNKGASYEEYFYLDMEYYEGIIKMFCLMRKDMSDAEKSVIMKSVSLDSDDFNLFDFFSYFQKYIRKEYFHLNFIEED